MTEKNNEKDGMINIKAFVCSERITIVIAIIITKNEYILCYSGFCVF